MKRNGFYVMARLIVLVKPLAGFMTLAILMGLLGNLCATFIMIFGGFAMLNILNFETPFSLGVIFSSMIIFALARSFLRYAEQKSNHYIAFRLLALIRDKVFRSLRKLCPAKLEGRDKGDLISVITSDIELLEVFYAHTISPIAIAFLFTIIMCVFIGSFNAMLGVFALCAYIAVGVLIPIVISKTSGENGMKFRNASADLSGFVLDSLRGLSETIQYNDGENRLLKMKSKTDELSKIEKKMKQKSGLNFAITNTVILIFDLAMLFASSSLYKKGAVDFSGVLIPVVALFSSFGPVVALASLGSTLQNTFAAGNRVLDIIAENPLVEEIEGKDEIEFSAASAENVSFSYSNEKILENLSIEILENKVIGIVGKSGSGKSTLLKLFMRFWKVKDGAIKISGQNVNEINTRNLRDMESFMTQDTHLFCDSIKNNIKIAKLDATDAEIEQACKKASVHDFIMTLPNGYDTKVSELGESLSGGERQRLGLARAFLHNAPFMLLDEPTSNLDSLNEAVILKSLKEERNGKTIVLVSHRVSTMGICDETYSVRASS